MSEASPSWAPESFRSWVRRQLEATEPGLRLVAEDLFALSSRVDWVGVDAQGRAVLILIAEEGRDLECFTRALANRVWVLPRVRDWAQLAPALNFRPSAGVRALLLCGRFDPETEAAAASLPGAPVELGRCHAPASELEPGRIELLTPRPGAPAADTSQAAPVATPCPAPPPALAPARDPAPFRSGLSEADLGLTPDEQREFE